MPVSAPIPPAAPGQARRPRVVVVVAAYAALVLAAVASGNVWLGELAALALISLFLLPALRRRSRLAWASWLAAAGVLLLLGARGQGRLALDAMPVVVNVALCNVFARTLRRGHEPLIARIIAALEGRERLALPRVATYARALTAAWAWLLGLQAVVLAAVFAGAVPGGALAAFGVTLPFALHGAAWRGYLHLGSYALVLGFLVLEYGFRRWYLRAIPHPPLAVFITRLVQCWPSLLHNPPQPASRTPP